MDELNIQRINELARKQKTAEGLTQAEKEEQAELRKAYVAAIRRNLRAQLDNIDLINPDGSVSSAKEEHDKKFGKGEYDK